MERQPIVVGSRRFPTRHGCDEGAVLFSTLLLQAIRAICCFLCGLVSVIVFAWGNDMSVYMVVATWLPQTTCTIAQIMQADHSSNGWFGRVGCWSHGFRYPYFLDDLVNGARAFGI